VSELIAETAESYAQAHTTPLEGVFAEVAEWTRTHTDVPQMISGAAEARLLQALIVVGGARRVLEIGTFTGFGTLAMAAASRRSRSTRRGLEPRAGTSRQARSPIASS
jgi:caffeoyl-CoA O-methyltransferase